MIMNFVAAFAVLVLGGYLAGKRLAKLEKKSLPAEQMAPETKPKTPEKKPKTKKEPSKKRAPKKKAAKKKKKS